MFSDVLAFLESLQLEQYASQLQAEGYEDMDTLAMMSRQDMQNAGLKPGHALKLHRALASSTSLGFTAALSGCRAFVFGFLCLLVVM